MVHKVLKCLLQHPPSPQSCCLPLQGEISQQHWTCLKWYKKRKIRRLITLSSKDFPLTGSCLRAEHGCGSDPCHVAPGVLLISLTSTALTVGALHYTYCPLLLFQAGINMSCPTTIWGKLNAAHRARTTAPLCMWLRDRGWLVMWPVLKQKSSSLYRLQYLQTKQTNLNQQVISLVTRNWPLWHVLECSFLPQILQQW